MEAHGLRHPRSLLAAAEGGGGRCTPLCSHDSDQAVILIGIVAFIHVLQQQFFATANFRESPHIEVEISIGTGTEIIPLGHKIGFEVKR